MHKLLIASMTVAALVGMPIAALADEQLALNNYSHEMTTCAAYFLVVSTALDNSNKPDLAAEYKNISTRGLQLAIVAGKGAGLLDETTNARFEMEFVEMTKRIDGNTSNIAILNKDYFELCVGVMQDPDKRLKYWLSVK